MTDLTTRSLNTRTTGYNDLPLWVARRADASDCRELVSERLEDEIRAELKRSAIDHNDAISGLWDNEASRMVHAIRFASNPEALLHAVGKFVDAIKAQEDIFVENEVASRLDRAMADYLEPERQ